MCKPLVTLIVALSCQLAIAYPHLKNGVIENAIPTISEANVNTGANEDKWISSVSAIGADGGTEEAAIAIGGQRRSGRPIC